MEWQTILVALAILAAFLYAGKSIFAKAKSFSAKNECGADCGCAGRESTKLKKY